MPRKNPINFCEYCGKPIVRMRRVATKRGFKLIWSKARTCSPACRKAVSRARLKRQLFSKIK